MQQTFNEEEIYPRFNEAGLNPKEEFIIEIVGENNDIYKITLTRDPDSVHCTCKGFRIYKYCHHLKDNKKTIINFFKESSGPPRVVADTSIEAYYHLISEDEINNRQIEYIQALFRIGHPATDLEVSRYAGHSDPNYFRPRRYEVAGFDNRFLIFKAHPLVKQVDSRPCKISKKRAKIWKLTDLGERIVKIIIHEGKIIGG